MTAESRSHVRTITPHERVCILSSGVTEACVLWTHPLIGGQRSIEDVYAQRQASVIKPLLSSSRSWTRRFLRTSSWSCRQHA